MYASDHVQEKEAYNAHIDVSGIDERKLLRKLDWYLVPWLSFLYLLSFLDRTSIGNAKVSMSVDYLGAAADKTSIARSCITWKPTYTLQTSSTTLRSRYSSSLTRFLR